MKRKQITAILMSAIMTVSACMPMNGISAMAAETAGAGGTEVAAEVDADAGADTDAEEATVEEPKQEPAEDPAQEQAENPAVTAEPAEPAQPESAVDGDDGETAGGSGAAMTSETAATDENAEIEESGANEETADTEEPAESDKTSAEDLEEKEEITDAEEIETENEVKNANEDDFDSAVDIAPGDSVFVSLNEDSPYYFFRFVPDTYATYRIYSDGEGVGDPFVTLYDADYNELAENDDYENMHFSLEYALRAGHTYYFRVNNTFNTECGFTVYLEKLSEHTLYVEGDEEETVEVTCPVTDPITLSVTAESSLDTITYRWTNESGRVVNNTASYVFTPEASQDYECRISDGNETIRRTFRVVLNHFQVENVYNSENPIAITTEYGQTAQLNVNVSADDMSGLTYEWYVSEEDVGWTISNPVNASSYETEAVTGVKDYFCRISDQYGNGGSVSFRVFVENNLKAYVITDPDNIDEDQTTAEIDTVYGSDVTLKVGVSATDTTGITYKWRYFHIDTPVDCDSSEFTLENIQEENIEYFCIVTDRYGNERECGFYISAAEPFIEVSEDSSTYYDLGEGDSIILEPEIDTNIKDTLSYAWYYNGVAIPGETSATLALDDTAKTGIYAFEASYQDYSGDVIYEVVRENNLEARAKDSVDVKVELNDPAELEVVATADDGEGITYQWYEVDDEEGETPISGADSAVYSISSVTAAAKYCCIVTDKYNNKDYVYFDVRVENHLYVHIAGEPDYINEVTRYCSTNSQVTLEVEAYADDMSNLTYEWRRETGGQTYITTGSSNKYNFWIGRYNRVTVEVSDQYGNTAYAYFNLYRDNGFTTNPEAYIGDEPLSIEREYEDERYFEFNLTVLEGKTVTLYPRASVYLGSLSYTWSNNESDDIGNDSTLTFTVDPDIYNYTCTIKDNYDNEWTLSFDITIDNQFDVYPEGAPGCNSKYIYAAPGSEVTLTTIATALNMDGMTYTWYGDVDDPEDNSNSVTVTVNDKMEIDCAVRDKYFNFKTVRFFIYPENHLLVYPENSGEMWNGSYTNYMYIEAEAGEELDLRVHASADNTDSITYNWEKDIKYTTSWGENEYDSEYIEGETSDTLHITADESTKYYCYVSDGYGSSKTVTFEIQVGGLFAYPEGATEVDGMPGNRIAISSAAGGNRTLRVITIAPEDETLTYKWTEGPLNDSSWWPLEEGKDSITNELTIDLDTAKRYLCVVSDTHGNQALVYFYVNVGGITLTSNYGTPELVGDNSYIVDVPVKVGVETTLEAIVDSDHSDGVYYKWIDDEYDTIKGATESSYTFTGGVGTRYTCKVTDANGTVSNLTFILQTDNELSAKCAGEADGTTEKDIQANIGDTVTLAMDVTCLNDNNLHYEWVDNLGRKVGEGATCTVTVKESGTYTGRVIDGYGNRKVVAYRILTDTASIEDAQITLSENHYEFDGKAKKPAVTVVLNGITLQNGKDYTVSYENIVDPGTATVIIKGRTVAGTKIVTFEIGKLVQTPVADVDTITVAVGATKTINVSDCHTAISASGVKTAIATATVSEQTVSVKGVKVGTYELTLTAAEDDVYGSATVTSKSGNATIVIKVVPGKTTSVSAANANKGIKVTWKKVTGATNYVIKRQAGSGSWKTVKTVGNVATYTDTYANTNGTKYTYRVYAKAATGTSNLYRAVVCYKALRPTISSVTNSASKKMTVKWAKNAKATGYQIQYGLKSSFSGAKSVKITKNTVVSKVIGSLTKGKKYYVRMRSYKSVSGKIYYSTWSATKTVTIKK